jgi:hypothetical protein
LILGWRLTSEPGDSSRPGQFRIVDLLEWVTTIAVGLGSIMFLISDMDRQGMRSIPAVDLFLDLVPLPLLIGVPVALAIVAERPPGACGKLAFTRWCIAVTIGLVLADLRHLGVSMRILLILFARRRCSRGDVPCNFRPQCVSTKALELSLANLVATCIQQFDDLEYEKLKLIA